MNSGQGVPIFKNIFTTGLSLLVLLLTQTSCQKTPSTSIVVVAVDSLSMADVSCTQRPASQSGLTLLCEDSVRFTHAYTPSTLSAPALASLVTGLYPFQHHLHSNGAPGLSATLETVPERALEKKYRTAFFSGGAPIFRKTGLNQGFEYFDDGVLPNLQQIYKPLKNNIAAFETWLTQEVRRDPFMAYFYVPDLNFIDTVTVSPTGESRSRSYDSQLEELDTQLLQLIKVLKKRNLWRETLFVFTGLNGRIIHPRFNELAPLNVHVENTQVPLFIKPPQAIRDINLHWTIDRNVSLVDVGVTLMEMIGTNKPLSHDDFPSFSLKPALFKVDAIPPEDRPLLMESGWAQWRKVGGLRAAVVSNQDYIVLDQKPKYFNLLTDRLEQNPLPASRSGSERIKNMTDLLFSVGYIPFKLDSAINEDRYSIPYMTWVDPQQLENLKKSLQSLHQNHPADSEILNWLAAVSLETNDWSRLKQLTEKSKNQAWALALKTHLESDSKIHDPCWSLVSKPSVDNQLLKNCPDALFRELITWVKTDNKDPSKEWLRIRFSKSYQQALVDRKILKANMGLFEVWDVTPDLLLRPTYADLYLNRAENQNLKTAILKVLPKEEEEY